MKYLFRIFLFIFLTQIAWSSDVELAWIHSVTPTVKGYKIFIGTNSGKYLFYSFIIFVNMHFLIEKQYIVYNLLKLLIENIQKKQFKNNLKLSLFVL